MTHETAHGVEIVTVPSTTAAVVQFHAAYDELAGIGEPIGRAFGTVMTELGRAGVHPTGPALACYEPASDGFEVSAGFRVADTFVAPPGLRRLDLGGVLAAHTTHLGPYSALPAAYEELQAQAARVGHPLGARGPMWEEYWSPPGTPEAQTRTEIYWPVATEAE